MRPSRPITPPHDGRGRWARAVPDRLYEAGTTNVWLVPSLSDVSSNTTGIAFRQKKGGVVAGDFMHVPWAREPGKHSSSGQQPDRLAPVLPDHEELPELVGCTRTDQHTATDLTVDVDQEADASPPRQASSGPSTGSRSGAEVTTVDLGEVVRVELKQSADYRLVALERWDQPDIHAHNLPGTEGRSERQPRHRTSASGRRGNYC